MRRTDTLLVIVVGGLALFVATQISRRKPTPAPSVAKAPVAPAPVAPAPPRAAVAPQGAPAVTPTAPTTTRPALHDVDTPDPRRDMPGTYFSPMVADLDGRLVRWPDRREKGLRVWVQSMSTVRDWDSRYAQMARNAFDEWGSVGLPLRFDFILDSASSDIQIVWTDRFPADQGRRVGLTERATDETGWIQSARITVAIHDSTDRMIPPSNLLGVVRHEAGHALGLGHSNDPKTMMYAVQTVTELSAADRATVKLLYQFPPGRVR